MADHDELVAEMLVLEQMGTQERQKLAKKRRLQQLKKWIQREKEWIAKEKQLNKRLASILNEENNGLKLKEYTTYSSNQRTKNKRFQQLATTTLTTKDKLPTTTNNSIEDKNKLIVSIINNNNLATIDGPYATSLTPHGRVHFNVGVMLLEAAARNDYDEVKRLLTLGVSPDSVNHDGLTALHQCCIDASEPIMNLLLEFGADVDARDTERWTPLHAACTCGHLNLVKILVEHNADLLAVNGDGNMPFDICEDEATLDYIESQMIKRGITQEMIDLTRASTEIQMLAELERLASTTTTATDGLAAKLNQADDNGVSQLHVAAANNYLSVVKFLLKHGVNVNVCDSDKWTPLHGVACWGNEQHIKVTELLVEAGANLDAKTSSDESVFDLCDNVELLERLNQLKDELESKQAIGTDRLRRTQSRTNSRVHSVRRTRVQDKNQISRREAREEAMLRVESSENVANGDTPDTGLQNEGPPAKVVTNGSDQRTKSAQSNSPAPPKNQPADITPVETNLNQTPPPPPPPPPLSDARERVGEPLLANGSILSGSQSEDVSRSQQEPSQNGFLSANKQTQPGSSLTSTIKENGHKQTTTIKHNNMTTTMQISSPTTKASDDLDGGPLGSHSDQPSSSGTSRKVCDVTDERQQLSQQQATTVVQVQFTPMNYTLSNLKKHRSDLRLRGVLGSTSSSSVQLEPEPMLSHVSSDNSTAAHSSTKVEVTAQANGWPPGATAVPNPSPLDGASAFNKFHGEPSEAIEGRRYGHKCCVII